MSLPQVLQSEDLRSLTREECACIVERELELAVEEITEHPEGERFLERLMARLPAECISLLMECDLLQADFDS